MAAEGRRGRGVPQLPRGQAARLARRQPCAHHRASMSAVSPTRSAPAARAAYARRVPLAWLLVGGATLFVALTVGSVLAFTLINARDSTFALVRDKASLALTQMESSIAGLLDPVERTTGEMARLFAAGALDLADNRTRTVDSFSGALVALPQAAAFAFARYDGTAVIVARLPDGSIREVEMIPTSARRIALALERATTLGAPAWVEPIWLPVLNQPIVSVVAPVSHNGTKIGAVVASVTLGAFDTFLDRQQAVGALRAFVLYDRQYVLGHPNSRGIRVDPGEGSTDVPLPAITDLQDRALDLIDGGSERIDELLDPPAIVDARLGDRHVVLLRDIAGRGPRQWTLGLVFAREQVGAELHQLAMTAIAGAGLLVAAIILAWLASRALAGRIAALTAAADRLRNLNTAAAPVPPSRVRELDNAAEAFNAMAGALAWFVTYVPRTLVQRLMQRGDSATAAQAVEVTVMFTDIRGFSTLSQDLPAGATASLLNNHFELLAAEIEATGGTVDKYIGDGLMAFWGAPEPRPDHAEAALTAATAIAGAIAADNARRRADGHPAIAVRIGLHSGTVVVGNIGSRSRLNYTIVGDTVNVAARLEQLGKELAATDDCVVLLSDAVRDACRPAPPLVDCGAHALRGRAGTLRVWRVDTAT